MSNNAQEMTVRGAYRVHRNAARNVGRGRGYTARGLEQALPVLEAFWAWAGTSIHVTEEMIDRYDKEVNHGKGNGT